MKRRNTRAGRRRSRRQRAVEEQALTTSVPERLTRKLGRDDGEVHEDPYSRPGGSEPRRRRRHGKKILKRSRQGFERKRGKVHLRVTVLKDELLNWEHGDLVSGDVSSESTASTTPPIDDEGRNLFFLPGSETPATGVAICMSGGHLRVAGWDAAYNYVLPNGVRHSMDYEQPKFPGAYATSTPHSDIYPPDTNISRGKNVTPCRVPFIPRRIDAAILRATLHLFGAYKPKTRILPCNQPEL